MDLLRDEPARLFRKYLAPSVSASLVTSIYILADTIMIGRGCGVEALTALNLVLPAFAIMFACGMLFGVGGGVLYSVARGAGDETRANAVWSSALVLAAVTAAILTLLTLTFFEPLCYLLGADETNIQMVKDYGFFVASGSSLFLFSSFLQTFVRNDRAPRHAMLGVLAGSATNIILDYVFIFSMDMGLTGGAAATVIGNAVTVGILLLHLCAPGNGLHFKKNQISLQVSCQVVSAGAPSFLIEASTGLTTFCFNRQLLRYIGRAGVAVYTVIANYALVMQSLYNGTSQAAQPIMAANFGARQNERVLSVRRLGVATVLCIGVLAVTAAVVWPLKLLSIFVAPTDELSMLAEKAIRMYFPAFLATGVNLFLTTWFQSVIRPIPALTIMLLRGVILPVTLAMLLPALFGGEAIFTAVLIAECTALAVAIVFARLTSFNKPHK